MKRDQLIEFLKFLPADAEVRHAAVEVEGDHPGVVLAFHFERRDYEPDDDNDGSEEHEEPKTPRRSLKLIGGVR